MKNESQSEIKTQILVTQAVSVTRLNLNNVKYVYHDIGL